MALALQAPELQISEEESAQYAKAIAAVARHYDLGASAKALDWTNLLTTMGSIYGVRAMALVARRRGHNGGPAMNGHDPAAPAPDRDFGDIDMSSMTGRTN